MEQDSGQRTGKKDRKVRHESSAIFQTKLKDKWYDLELFVCQDERVSKQRKVRSKAFELDKKESDERNAEVVLDLCRYRPQVSVAEVLKCQGVPVKRVDKNADVDAKGASNGELDGDQAEYSELSELDLAPFRNSVVQR